MKVRPLSYYFSKYASRRVLLIGNGPSILDHPAGQEIDAFNGPVVRFNEFVLEPVEYTGTRTDLWVICPKSHDVRFMHPDLVHLMVKVPMRIQYYGVDPKEIDKHRGCQNPHDTRSTGIATMFWCLEEGYEVVLHGFDHFAPDKLVHYYAHDRGFDICGQRGHKKDKEIVEQAIIEGEPVSYMRGC